ncbi:MAG: Uma2 family endonuclease [Anaerolineae bacterium]|nr:Uma2 family endonuclease [Anaerolineae bacterium]
MADLPHEKTAISLDDLLDMGEDTRVEIIHGELIEMTAAGVLHQIIIGNFFRTLDPFASEHGLGAVFTDGLTYLMHSDPRSLRHSFVPDVSFIRRENIPAGFDLRKPFPGVPDLAVEVVSPNDKAVDVQEKILIYLEKGAEQVWVAYPEPGRQSLHQYRRDQSTMRIYQKPEEVIDTSALFPGLEALTVATIFSLPAWATDEA